MLKSNKWNENQNDQQQQQCHDDNLYTTYKCKSQNGIKSEEKKTWISPWWNRRRDR